MKKKNIKLIPMEDDWDEEREDEKEGRSFEFDLTPYLVTCAMACGIMFVTRFVRKHVFHEDLYKKYRF